jgi:hypothetical protein
VLKNTVIRKDGVIDIKLKSTKTSDDNIVDTTGTV